MKTILNVIWLVLSGFWLFLAYLLAGLILCITIIGIPFGIASFRIAGYALWPFGRTTVERPDAGAPSLVGNILWIVLAGWWLALAHITTGIVQCLTIIGIPLGFANFKLIPISLMPLGREVVSTDQAFATTRW
ncbi:YccF domain-containing protein [Streptomyces sp. NA04227]|uniref:YccF domain-containing protein n=1 Tax=Streptomyces sp. NA04227 TaxID=2742136 RepID=UPI00159260B6|nr:YccF domain-containing protein [Streptomyces sp. NA04227]QKW08554.1 YccF domain-containing protein [Streptomyces sp. NA04227]